MPNLGFPLNEESQAAIEKKRPVLPIKRWDLWGHKRFIFFLQSICGIAGCFFLKLKISMTNRRTEIWSYWIYFRKGQDAIAGSWLKWRFRLGFPGFALQMFHVLLVVTPAIASWGPGVLRSTIPMDPGSMGRVWYMKFPNQNQPFFHGSYFHTSILP